MLAVHEGARRLAERFTGERPDRITPSEALRPDMKELREVSLGWIEHHTERKLATRQLLENS
jgi:hypothetical protein